MSSLVAGALGSCCAKAPGSKLRHRTTANNRLFIASSPERTLDFRAHDNAWITKCNEISGWTTANWLRQSSCGLVNDCKNALAGFEEIPPRPDRSRLGMLRTIGMAA